MQLWPPVWPLVVGMPSSLHCMLPLLLWGGVQPLTSLGLLFLSLPGTRGVSGHTFLGQGLGRHASSSSPTLGAVGENLLLPDVSLWHTNGGFSGNDRHGKDSKNHIGAKLL